MKRGIILRIVLILIVVLLVIFFVFSRLDKGRFSDDDFSKKGELRSVKVSNSVESVKVFSNDINSFGGDSGSLEDPFIINSCEELQDMDNNLSAHYALGNNIDCSDTVNWNYGAGFDPIGDNNNIFIGSFNGRNHTITGLYINSESGGLFDVVGDYVIIRDVGLTNAFVRGGSNYVGGLIGRISGSNVSIINCHVIGEVIGYEFVGGLIGASFGSEIINSYSSVNVRGGGFAIGGLVGFSFGNMDIIDSYATGNVEGASYVGGLVGQFLQQSLTESNIINSYATGNVTSSFQYAGGLVGFGRGNVINSYATGNVEGASYVGGLAGQFYGDIKNSYSVGNVIGFNKAGGLVGFISGDIINSYYDEANVVITCNSECNIYGSETYVHIIDVDWLKSKGWNFVNDWSDAAAVDYPILKWQYLNLNIVSPISGIYNVNVIDLNVSSYRDLDFCKFSLDNWNTEHDMTKVNSRYFSYTISSMITGDYTAEFLCEDSNGIISMDSVGFSVNLVCPPTDVDKDGDVDISDLVLVGQDFGKEGVC